MKTICRLPCILYFSTNKYFLGCLCIYNHRESGNRRDIKREIQTWANSPYSDCIVVMQEAATQLSSVEYVVELHILDLKLQ